jgi:hypothetical protein
MDKPHQNGEQFFEAVEKAIAAGEGLSDQDAVHLFDTAANHVASTNKSFELGKSFEIWIAEIQAL